MWRWWVLGIALGLVACADQPPPPVAPPVDAAAVLKADQPDETCGNALAALTAVLERDPPADPDETSARCSEALDLLGDVETRLPGGEAMQGIRQAIEALDQADSPPAEEVHQAVREAVAAARGELADDGPWGPRPTAIHEALEEVEAVVAADRWSAVRIELGRVEALLTITPLAAPLSEARAALEEPETWQPEAALSALASLDRARHLVAARCHIARAWERVEALAFGDARQAMDAARSEVDVWAAGDRGLQRAAASLRQDMDGVEADLQANAPGLAQRLEALWKKLGREPLPNTEP